MRVIPGTHLMPDSPNYRAIEGDAPVTFAYEVADVDESAAVSLVLAPGEASLHDSRIMHASFPNRSDDFRVGFVMRYFPATVGVQASRMDRHRLWLARGRNHGANRYENE
jgi:ectoine hydroxylase-related dioxygenase (phytanoyl-CoA dioxygenase family)